MSIESNALRKSAGHPEARCFIESPVCGDATEAKTAGCVLCHWRFDGNAGFGQKPDDFIGGFGCGPCHTWMDSNGVQGPARGSEEWLFYAFRSMVRTLRFWATHGFMTIKGAK